MNSYVIFFSFLFYGNNFNDFRLSYKFISFFYYCINFYRYKQRIVWDKKDRMDLIFGSSPGLLALANPRSDSEVDFSLSSGSESWTEIERGSEEVVDLLEKEEGQEEQVEEQEQAVGDEIINQADTDGVSTYTDNAFDSTYDDWDDDMDINTKIRKNLKIEDVIATYDNWLISRDLKVEEKNAQTFYIFCDLDGVLVDFEAGVRKLFKNKKTAGKSMVSSFILFVLVFQGISVNSII